MSKISRIGGNGYTPFAPVDPVRGRRPGDVGKAAEIAAKGRSIDPARQTAASQQVPVRSQRFGLDVTRPRPEMNAGVVGHSIATEAAPGLLNDYRDLPRHAAFAADSMRAILPLAGLGRATGT